MSEHTPTVEAFRGVYGQMCAEWCRDDALAEFDRFIARIKAEALREAADAVRKEAPDEPWAGATYVGFADWMVHRADRVEKDEAGL